jgi:hypothetical protein
MTSINSKENQRICVDLVTDNIDNLRSSVHKVTSILTSDTRNTLDTWLIPEMLVLNSRHINNNLIEHYKMPRKLDWNLFRRIYDIQPQNYEELLSIHGVGPATVRSLSLIGELIYGTKASWEDPVKFSFAHGGKDGVPYPIARKTYDRSISYLASAIEGAEIERHERIHALKKLSEYSCRIFEHN